MERKKPSGSKINQRPNHLKNRLKTKPNYKQVFVNRTLDMKKINYIGLDMDLTLVRYKTKNFSNLAYKKIIDFLVEKKKYPSIIRKLKPDYERNIRGLVVDQSQGNILKLSRFGAIRRSYHGLSPISVEEKNPKKYQYTYIDLRSPNYESVDTHFSISFAILFGQLVELKDLHKNLKFPKYETISRDLIEAETILHQTGPLKNIVCKNFSKYIKQDPKLVMNLEKYVKYGKKIFIVTNSEPKYTEKLLNYTINPFLKNHKKWQELFEFVVTAAEKPDFFYKNTHFLKFDPKKENFEKIKSIQKHQIYLKGNAKAITAQFKIHPNEILYIGDHIYSDIVRLKKGCGWRTALVIEELEDEIKKNVRTKTISKNINNLIEQQMFLQNKLDNFLSLKNRKNQSKYKGNEKNKIIKKIKQLDKKLKILREKKDKVFNNYWGETFREGIEETYFSYLMERFSCIYMSQLNHFLEVSPEAYYSSYPKNLPHEK